MVVLLADNQKYYYLKLKDNFYDSEEMIILQSMPDGYLYSDVLMKLYLRSLKSGGKLMFRDRIPYTPTILAQIVKHNVGVVEKALKVFAELGFIEILENGAIYMLDIQTLIGRGSSEAERKAIYRKKIEENKKLLMSGTILDSENKKNGKMSDSHDKMPGTMSRVNLDEKSLKFDEYRDEDVLGQCPGLRSQERELELEIELDIEIEKERDAQKDLKTKKDLIRSSKDEQLSLLEVDKFFEKVWTMYPKKTGKSKIKKKQKERIFKLGDEFIRCINRYLSEPELKINGQWKEIVDGATFFNNRYAEWTDKEYNNSFSAIHNFESEAEIKKKKLFSLADRMEKEGAGYD